MSKKENGAKTIIEMYLRIFSGILLSSSIISSALRCCAPVGSYSSNMWILDVVINSLHLIFWPLGNPLITSEPYS